MTAPHPPPITLLQQLQERVRGERPPPTGETVAIPVDSYLSQARFEQEQALFRRTPLAIGHEAQLPEAGDTLVHDWLGLPLLTMRDKAGQIGTFMNVCRHRGMRLLQDEGQTCVRSLVCPYHNWTYGLDGDLRNIPLKESFGELEKGELGLVPVPTEVRHGLIWVQATPGEPMDLDGHLAGLGSELETFGIPDLHFGQQAIHEVKCNWKLVQDAFLDGYHVVRLHKNTVGGFFPDALAETDTIGRHVRSAVARKEIFDAADASEAELDLRKHASFSYTVFPNVVLVLHPEYSSIISLFPKAPDRTLFIHSMLSPRPINSDKAREHFARSFKLIDSGVFLAEDIHVSVGSQRGLASGANEALLFGGFEAAAAGFHRILAEAL
ncbi:MAG: aromatic ring-hydroxylating dioxygenase subunit alpha [Pseudomonadota bacterium]